MDATPISVNSQSAPWTLAAILPADADPVTRLVWQIITRRRDKPECWDSNESIAAKVGRSVRTVQIALRKLKSLGLILVKQVRAKAGPGSRSNRRILLRSTTGDGKLGATDCAQSAQPVAPRSATPSDSPLVEPDGSSEMKLEFDDDNRPTAIAPAPGPPAPVEPVSSSSSDSASPGPESEPEGPRRATPEEREAVVDKAQALFGEGPYVRGKVLRAAKKWRLSWVLAALDQCQKARERDGTVQWGYLYRTLANFQAEGGPPPPKPANPLLAMTEEEFITFLKERGL